MSGVVRRKYLERYAEPEARFALELRHQYSAALVIPLYHEDASFLEQIGPAASRAPGRVLVIAVVNATEEAPAATHAENARLLQQLDEWLVARQQLAEVEGSPARALLGRPGPFDLLLIDRASPGRQLPTGEGVGLARRIGMDLALALHEAGGLLSPWLASTDADARLPDDYFGTLASLEPVAPDGTRRVALTLPFWHTPTGDAGIDDATALYELSLRYYTLGLAAAGSPYAYESLGSALAVEVDAYAEVRGVPKRRAGEDFYLLDKLAKVGSIHRPDCAPIAIASRASSRVPFGTGPGVREVVERGGSLAVYHPRTFELLGLALKALRRAAVVRNEEAVVTELSRSLDVGTIGAVSTALEELQAFEALRDTLGASPDPQVRERRLLTWFDALRTLRFIHLIEVPAALPRLAIRDAFAKAAFCGFYDAGMSVEACRIAAADAERLLPQDVGAEAVVLAR